MSPARLMLFAAAAACAIEPFRHDTDLFEAGTNGYAHYRVPAIVVSPRGTVMAFTEARRSARGDWGPQDILMRRSRDGGRTWDSARAVARVDGDIPPNPVALAQELDKPGDVTYNNFVPIADFRRKTMHFVFCAEYARCYYMQSTGDGDTFTPARDITPTFEEFRRDYGWKVIAAGPGHGIQLRTGRLLVPVWLSDGTGGHAHRPSIVSVIYSDNHGQTWRRGDIVVRHPELTNPSETVAVELSSGVVALNIRSESNEHRRAVSISKDGAHGWSRPEFQSELLEPVCMASMIRYSPRQGDKRSRILFANPHSSEPRDPSRPLGNHKRQNVSVKLSYDEGKTWPVSRVLDPGPSGYTDLAVGPDGTIYCIYERGAVSGSDTYIKAITVARFNLEWLTHGKRDSFRRL